MNVVIVDDEELLRASMRSMLADIPSVKVVAEAANVDEGIRVLSENECDVVLMDIKLKNGTGFEILENLGSEFKGKVIFTTAFDQYALKAIKMSAVDYLLKPIDFESLKNALEKAKGQDAENQKLNTLLQNIRSIDKKIALASAERIQVVPVKEIVRCESDNNYTTFVLNNGSKTLISKTLKEYEGLLEDFGFLRVHQSHLVNMRYVTSFEKKGSAFLILADGTSIPVSQRKRESVVDYLKSL